MRSIIFANYIARDTRRLGATSKGYLKKKKCFDAECFLNLIYQKMISLLLNTVDVEHSHVRFLGNLVLNLWDCGG